MNTIGLLYGIILTCTGPVAPQDAPLILGVDTNTFFISLGLNAHYGGISESGVLYRTAGEPDENKHSFPQCIIAVYTSSNLAKEGFMRDESTFSTGLTPLNESIGDEAKWTGHFPRPEGVADGGTILLRRANVVFRLVWAGDRGRAIALARQVDQIFKDDRAIAPMGSFNPTPRIEKIGLPVEAATGEKIRIAPVFEGMEFTPLRESFKPVRDAGRIILVSSALGGTNRLRLDGDSLFVELSDQTGYVELTLSAADERNVIVTKTVTIRLLPRPEPPDNPSGK